MRSGGLFFFSSRRRHTRWTGDWSSDVCSSDLASVRDLRLLPDRWAGTAAGSTAAAEAGVAVSLVVPSAAVASTGLLLAGVLLACLGGTVLQVVHRGVPATCRCFGASDVPLQRWH